MSLFICKLQRVLPEWSLSVFSLKETPSGHRYLLPQTGYESLEKPLRLLTWQSSSDHLLLLWLYLAIFSNIRNDISKWSQIVMWSQKTLQLNGLVMYSLACETLLFATTWRPNPQTCGCNHQWDDLTVNTFFFFFDYLHSTTNWT